MKNIVWIHSHFLYWMGGTKFIFEVVKRLHQLSSKSAKTKIIVIVEQAGALALEQYQKDNIQVINLDSSTSTQAWYWLLLPWFIQRRRQQVRAVLKAHHFSLRNTTLVTSMFPMNAVVQGLGYRHVQLCYEPFSFFYDPEFIKTFSFGKQIFVRLIAALYAHLDKAATQAADLVLTLNKVTQEAIQDTYHVGSELVYAGVDTARFKPYVPAALKKKYQRQPVAIHSTDYSPVKGTDRVIKAMRQVVNQVPKAKLLITTTIQNPTAEAKLRDLAASLKLSKNVEFMGFLPIAELPHYYSLAQVLVQGSNSAKSGTTSMALPVKEAMCCGTPAIRPDVGGDDVVDGVSGYLVDPADTNALAAAMTKLLKDARLSRKFGQAARQKIVKTYTWEKTVARIVKHL